MYNKHQLKLLSKRFDLGGYYLEDATLYAYNLLFQNILKNRRNWYSTPIEWNRIDDFYDFIFYFCIKNDIKPRIYLEQFPFSESWEEEFALYTEEQWDKLFHKKDLNEIKEVFIQLDWKEEFEVTPEEFDQLRKYYQRIHFINFTDDKSIPILKKFLFDILWYANIEIDLSQEHKKKLQKEFNTYLLKFRNDELILSRNEIMSRGSRFLRNPNVLVYQKQKEQLLNKISELEDKYGPNIQIIDPFEKYPLKDINENDDNELKEILKNRFKEQDFLFLHTLFSLEYEEYIEIKFLGTTWTMVTAEDDIYYKSRVEVKQSRNVYLQDYDPERKILTIGNKQVLLDKKGKETDGILLLETLLEDPNRIWYLDEIKENLGYRFDEELPKNKYYHARNKINEIINKETEIDDFIIGKTKEFQINPKYIEVDE